MYQRNEQHPGHIHQQYADLHRRHAQAYQQQAMYHQEQADLHHRSAQAYNPQGGQGQSQYLNAYNEKMTAYNDQVSPVALVFRGQISPEAIQSLNQYHNPYAHPSNPANPHLSQHAAHATEYQRALRSGYRF